VLRRRPQRLWRGCDQPVDPQELELDGDPPEGDDDCPALTPGAREALIEPMGMEEALHHHAAFEETERRLWGLSVTNRQVLYLTSIARLSHAEVMRCLGLPSETSLHDRAHRARIALRGPIPEKDSKP